MLRTHISNNRSHRPLTHRLSSRNRTPQTRNKPLCNISKRRKVNRKRSPFRPESQQPTSVSDSYRHRTRKSRPFLLHRWTWLMMHLSSCTTSSRQKKVAALPPLSRPLSVWTRKAETILSEKLRRAKLACFKDSKDGALKTEVTNNYSRIKPDRPQVGHDFDADGQIVSIKMSLEVLG